MIGGRPKPFGCTLPSTAIEISDFGQTFTLFPNPNKGDFQLDFGDLLKIDLKLTILDEMGRVMQEESLKPGLIKAEIHSSHLASGIYFVTISSTEKGNSVFKMLVKQ